MTIRPDRRLVILGAAALVAAGARAAELPHFTTGGPLPLKQYQQFRDQVILTGKCRAFFDAETPEDQTKGLEACWLDFIAPRS